MPTLADIYSGIATAKRQAGNLIHQPISTLQEMAALANDAARQTNKQTALSAQGARQELRGQPMTQEQALADQDLQQKLIDQMNIGGMTVYHGSPYKFAKFDPSKIGSGEGAQAYGHGLYVAENPNVAKEYAKNVKDMASIQELNAKLSRLNKVMEEDNAGGYRKFKSAKGQQAADEYDRLMEIRNQKSVGEGNFYKIDLPDEHIERMLDWDKPLAEQPQLVKNALSIMPHRSPEWTFKDTLETLQAAPHLKNDTSLNPTGSQIYSMFGKGMMVGNKAQGQIGVSKIMHELGIPGIKYLDQNSRGAGQGSKNFVIFPGNEHLLSIQDINGMPIK